MQRFSLLSALLGLVAVGASPGCGTDVQSPDNLLLSISSDAPASGGALESLRVLFRQGDEHYPADAASPDFNPMLGDGADRLDPVEAPVVLSVKFDGSTFTTSEVTLIVTGRVGDAPVTVFEGTVDLDTRKVLAVHLTALPSGCDDDGDGFLDCTIDGCCAADSVFADCVPDDATANPWATELECEPCDDEIDQDCSGADQPCVDEDNDGVADCAETQCGGPDPNKYPGAEELCDDIDNDCDGETDEGLNATFDKGDACGTGVCAGGVWECDQNDTTLKSLRCSTASNAADGETCGNNLDDNCDGQTDEGCGGDIDGDGFLTVGEEIDCNDYDAGIFPGAVEPCCPLSAKGDTIAEQACDKNCDTTVTFCDVADLDGDGFTPAQGDCDDEDPLTHPEADEKCGDGIDQDCFLGDLPCEGVTDIDSDGWPAGVDCDDDDKEINPEAEEVCDGVDNDCDGQTDEGNPDTNGACGESEGECALGLEVCVNSGELRGMVDCVGDIVPTGETCDGKDNDCDGDTDEDFTYGDDDLKIGEACDGVGACGVGTVECSQTVDAATCSSDPDGSDPDDELEVCDLVDNDCDGEINEDLTDVADSTCLKQGVCGDNLSAISAKCELNGTWTCGYSAISTYQANTETSCDGLDNDCDGGTDDEFNVTAGCDGDDTDSCLNGVITCKPGDPTGTYCDETNAQTAVEICDGEDNDCDGFTDEDFKDTSDNVAVLEGAAFAGDNGKFLGNDCGIGLCGAGKVECNPSNRMKLICVTPRQPSADICDDQDNDCNGVADDDFIETGTTRFDGGPFNGDDGKYKTQDCGTGECKEGKVICDTSDPNRLSLTCNTLGNIATDVCDGKDNNCDGTDDENFRAGGLFSYDGGPYAGDKGLVLDADCGVGACDGGMVVCDETDDDRLTLTCSKLDQIAEDVCDGADNDCDGDADEDYVSGGTVKLAGAAFSGDNGKHKSQDCGIGSCVDAAKGQVICDPEDSAKKTLACSTDGNAVAEICDTADNDCDGAVNEDFKAGAANQYTYDSGPWGGETKIYLGDVGCGTGDCSNGTVICDPTDNDRLTLTCDSLGKISEDLCDDADNDCNGVIDDRFIAGDANTVTLTGALFGQDNDLAKNAECGTGECIKDGKGAVICDPTDSTKMTLVCSTDANRADELCDHLDNDCDGADDENFKDHADNTVTYVGPWNGETKIYLGDTGCGTGACANGTVICDATDITKMTLTCSTLSKALDDELCDNEDNDCNGGVDEPFLDGTITYNDPIYANDINRRLNESCGTGVCEGGTVECVKGTKNMVCDAVEKNRLDEELCNDKDDTCDSQTDEGFPNGDDDDLADCVDPDRDNDGIEDNESGLNPGRTNCTGGNKVDCDDNCPFAANSDQADGDNDGIGDVCDPCLDADEDGWGSSTSSDLSTCPKPSVADCDDTNVNDSDGDNVCTNQGANCNGSGATGCSDNCPDEKNADQADTDGDGVGDVCDLCTDVDDDDWGSADFPRSGCPNGSDADCNDAKDNTDDVDGDNVCINNGDPCADGEKTGCSDNCPEAGDANPLQEDDDGDGIGNVCDLCTNADGDLWGAGGVGYDPAGPNCAGETAVDCNDAEGNTDDNDGDNVCINNGATCHGGGKTGCSDNCEDEKNPDQVDLDDDAVGDACDLCVNVDGDDWGQGAVRSGCTKKALDCDDTNVNDSDGDNVCFEGDRDACSGSNTGTCDDNCPSTDNPDQEDEDGDGIGDSCDDCTDVDGDGWGASGGAITACTGDPPFVNCCANGTTPDCNDDDTDATDDADHDNVCTDIPGGDVCGYGDTGCIDNCPDDANPDQRDSDGDGLGNVCDSCPDGQPPFEVCGDCIDNDCNGQVDDADAACVHRRVIAIETDVEGVPAGYAVSLTFDHKALVDAGLSNANGDDVRVYHQSLSNTYTSIPVVVDPALGDKSWNQTTTTIWFALQAAVSAPVHFRMYHLVTNATEGAANRDAQQIFHDYDDFARAELGGGWTVVGKESSGSTIAIDDDDDLLAFSGSSNDLHRPFGLHSFPALTTGRWEWRFGFDWDNTGGETQHAVWMQLGDDLLAPANTPAEADEAHGTDHPFPNNGIGPSLVWGEGANPRLAEDSLNETDEMHAEENGVIVGIGVVDGPDEATVTIDLDTQTWTPRFAGVANSISEHAAFDFSDSSVTQLTQVRFMTNRLDSLNHDPAGFSYHLIRPLVSTGKEPQVFIGVPEPLDCTITDGGGLLVRYYMDDEVDDTLGTTTVSDSAATPLDMTRAEISGSPTWSPNTLLRGIAFTGTGAGSVGVNTNNTKIETALVEATTATLELVVDQDSAPVTAYFFSIEETSGTFSLSFYSQGKELYLVSNDTIIGGWAIDLVAAGRTVLHVVFSSAAPIHGDETVALYRDGALVPCLNKGEATCDTTTALDIDGNHDMTLGTGDGESAQMAGTVYYAAVYSTALTAQQVLDHANVLSRNDDRPTPP